MLEEMEAYAKQALRIHNLECHVSELKEEIVSYKNSHIEKEIIKSWFSSIGDDYVFLSDNGKKEALSILGEKR